MLKRTQNIKITIVLFASLTLTACGGGGGGDSSPKISVTPPAANVAPTVNAGEDASLRVNTRVTLSAEAADSDGTIGSYKWEKTSHVAGEEYIELQDASTDAAFFDTNFHITEPQEYTFTVTVTDNDGATSSDEVTIIVLPVEHVDIVLPDNINQARLTALDDNTVLVTGGCKSINRVEGTTYDCVEPSLRAFTLDLQTETLTEISNVNFPKPYGLSAQSTVLLSDGRVMLNSQDIWNLEGYTHHGEIYDPLSQQFSPIASMNDVRGHAMPVVLENDTVIALGGYGIDSIETYSPLTDSWTVSATTFPNAASITTLLPNNSVLLVGGISPEGKTFASFIYKHSDQSVTEIDALSTADSRNGKTSGVFSNGGADYRRVDLGDNTFCLLSHSTLNFGGFDKSPIRFDLNTNSFKEDVSPCEKFWHLGGYSVDDNTFINGHALRGAAHIELKSDKVWVSQQINDVDMEYNESCDCYDYIQPMTIRIIKH